MYGPKSSLFAPVLFVILLETRFNFYIDLCDKLEPKQWIFELFHRTWIVQHMRRKFKEFRLKEVLAKIAGMKI